MRLLLVMVLLVTLCLSLSTAWAGISDGLVAHWDFREGLGTVLHDRTGNGNDGQINGAKWVKEGDVWALSFNGRTDFVDCGDGPTLDLRDQITMAFWLKLQPALMDGETGIIGKAYQSYMVSTLNGNVYPYTATPTTIMWQVPYGSWSLVVATYDGKDLKLYANGKLISLRPYVTKMNKGQHFWMGKSDGNMEWTKDSRLHGMLTDVRVYNRALTQEEVSELYATTNVNHTVDLSVTPLPNARAILVEVRSRGLGKSADSAQARLDLVKKGSKAGRPLATGTVKRLQMDGVVNYRFEVPGIPGGEYELRATPVDKRGKAIGLVSRIPIRWPVMEKFPNGPQVARRLNNLVTELLNVPGTGKSGKKYSFVNPRNGWIYIANKGSEEVTVSKSGGAQPQEFVLATKYNGANETMRKLPAGKYTITAGKVKDLIVRAVPYTVYCSYNTGPIALKHFATNDLDFGKKYIFPHVNTINSPGDFPANDPFIKEWVDKGGEWFVEHGGLLQFQPKEPNAENIYQYVAEMNGYNREYSSGVLGDEFGGPDPVCSLYAEAIRKMKSDLRYKDKVFFAWGLTMYNGPAGHDLIKALMETGGMYTQEFYMHEQPTAARQWSFINSFMVDNIRSCREQIPGCMPYLVPTIGYFNARNSGLDVLPSVNYKTHLEMEFNTVANHPDFKGIGGIVTYLNGFTTEEIVRFGAQLMRHYCIEGKTGMLLKDPYILPHLKNPDFDEGLKNWGLSSAEEGSIITGQMGGLGWLQGRYPPCEWGNNVLVTKRSEKKPNVFSQEVVDLVPGKLYSLEFINACYNDLTVKDIEGVSVDIEGVDLVTEKCFDEIYRHHPVHSVAPYSAENAAWFNFHFRVFKAKSKTAMLTISDWSSKEKPGGPAGQQMMYNFIQLEPFFKD